MSVDNAAAPSSTVNPAVAWRDSKRYLWLLGLLVPNLPFVGWGLASATGLGLFWWIGPLFIFMLVPACDLLIGRDTANPPDEALDRLEEDRYYRWVTYLFLPLQYAALVWACSVFADGDVALLDKIGLAMMIGAVAGVGINTAHELGHKKEEHERWFARIALAQPFYGHFYIEHNRGHHRRVATPEDPASSRLGETVYEFWLRTVTGSLRSAWEMERSRLARRSGSPWTLHNDVLSAWAMSAVLWGALVAAFGTGVLPYLVAQAAFGVLLLETVNYLEHYGMLRQVTPPAGRSASTRATAGTAATSPPTCCSITCSGTAITTPTRPAATRRYATSRKRRCCRPATPP